jgi:hypothetical protein
MLPSTMLVAQNSAKINRKAWSQSMRMRQQPSLHRRGTTSALSILFHLVTPTVFASQGELFCDLPHRRICKLLS